MRRRHKSVQSTVSSYEAEDQSAQIARQPVRRRRDVRDEPHHRGGRGNVGLGSCAHPVLPDIPPCSKRRARRDQPPIGYNGIMSPIGVIWRGMMPTIVTRTEVLRLLADGAQLVDVLPAEEYATEHLPGAVNIPLRHLETRAAAELDSTRPVIVYCWGPQ